MARSCRVYGNLSTRDGRLQEAKALHADALRFTSRGEYSRAAAAFRRALSLANDCSDPSLLTAILNDFGILSKYAGRFNRAKRLYTEALKHLPRGGRHSNESRAALYHNLAGLEHARGRPSRALHFARQGIRLRRQLSRGDRSALQADQAALAAILVDLGRLGEAEGIYRRLLPVYRRTFGATHYETASLLANLGALCAKAGRLDASERTLRRAAHALERALGKEHPRLASVLNNLATTCAHSGKIVEADALYSRVLHLLRRQPGPTYPSLALVRANQRQLKQTTGAPA